MVAEMFGVVLMCCYVVARVLWWLLGGYLLAQSKKSPPPSLKINGQHIDFFLMADNLESMVADIKPIYHHTISFKDSKNTCIQLLKLNLYLFYIIFTEFYHLKINKYEIINKK